MKKTRIFITILLLFFLNSNTFAEGNKSSYLTKDSRLASTAAYLNMSIKQYRKFTSAIRGDEEAELEGPGFSYFQQPGVIEFKSLYSQGLPIPQSLLDEVSSLFTLYKTGLAEYAGLSLQEFILAQKKLAIIEHSYVDLSNLSKGKFITNSTSDDEAKTVIVRKNEDEIKESSSGDHIGTVMEIHMLGLQFLTNGIWLVDIDVNFVSYGGQDLGTQRWRVSNSDAWPIGNVQGGALLPNP